MGDQSFARLIRKRRDTLGLTQARLGELVGRSASTIRNWERATSSPSERSDVVALAAILGLDESEALEHAGFESPTMEDRPTVEQAYASLTEETAIPAPPIENQVEPPAAPAPKPPDVPAAAESVPTPRDVPPPAGPVEPSGETETRAEGRPAPSRPVAVSPLVGATPDPPSTERVEPTPAPARRASVPEETKVNARSEPRRARRAAPPTVLEATAPIEPSYVEDPEERQHYRVRALVTAALVIGILVVLLWSFNRATDAIGGLWQGLIDSLAF